MKIVLIAVFVIMLLIVLICFIRTLDFFGTLPEKNRYRPVLAWDVLILFGTAVAIVFKLIEL